MRTSREQCGEKFLGIAGVAEFSELRTVSLH